GLPLGTVGITITSDVAVNIPQFTLDLSTNIAKSSPVPVTAAEVVPFVQYNTDALSRRLLQVFNSYHFYLLGNISTVLSVAANAVAAQVSDEITLGTFT